VNETKFRSTQKKGNIRTRKANIRINKIEEENESKKGRRKGCCYFF